MSDHSSDEIAGQVDALLESLMKATKEDGAGQHEFLARGCTFLSSLVRWMEENQPKLSPLDKFAETYQLTVPTDKAGEYVKQEMEILKELKLKKAAQDELERHVREVFATGFSANPVNRKTVLDTLVQCRDLICKVEKFTAPKTGGRLSRGLLKRIAKNVLQVVMIAGDSMAATLAFGGAAVGVLPMLVAACAAVVSIGEGTMALSAELPETLKLAQAEMNAWDTKTTNAQHREQLRPYSVGAVELKKKNDDKKE